MLAGRDDPGPKFKNGEGGVIERERKLYGGQELLKHAHRGLI